MSIHLEVTNGKYAAIIGSLEDGDVARVGRGAKADQESDRMLFLAVPESVYESFFKTEFITALLQKFQVRLITYDSDKEEILRWIK